jgi:hypothetical protein
MAIKPEGAGKVVGKKSATEPGGFRRDGGPVARLPAVARMAAPRGNLALLRRGHGRKPARTFAGSATAPRRDLSLRRHFHRRETPGQAMRRASSFRGDAPALFPAHGRKPARTAMPRAAAHGRNFALQLRIHGRKSARFFRSLAMAAATAGSPILCSIFEMPFVAGAFMTRGSRSALPCLCHSFPFPPFMTETISAAFL